MSYTITYSDAGVPGVSNLPSAQTKTEGVALQLSDTIPVRTGYNFLSWNTSYDGGGASYSPGGTYSDDADVMLFAMWSAVTYPIVYSINPGGTLYFIKHKTYDYPHTISAAPSPMNPSETFNSWNTLPNGQGTTYHPGDSYTTNAPLNLFAIWDYVPYQLPKITGVGGRSIPTVYRCTSAGVEDMQGTYAKVEFAWSTQGANGYQYRTYVGNESSTGSLSGTSGTKSLTIGGGLLSTDDNYTLTISVKDSNGGEVTWTTILSKSFLTLDFGGQGKAIGVGQKAPDPTGFSQGLMQVAMALQDGNGNFIDAIRNAVVVANGTDLNTLNASGFYYQQTAANTSTMTNIPENRGFWMVCNFNTAGTYGSQIICFYAVHRIYQRSSVGSTFSDWVLLNGDPVVDSGTTGIWKWKKYQSGDCEAWGVYDWTPSSVSSLTTGWYYAYSTAGDIQLPFQFKTLELFMTSVSKSQSGGATVEGNTATPASNITNLQVLLIQSTSTARRQYIQLYCKGTWK